VWCCLVGRDERRFGGKEVRADFIPFVSVLTVEDVHVCVCVCVKLQCSPDDTRMINVDCLHYFCSKFCVFYLGTPRTMLYYSAVSSCTWVRKRGCCLVWGFPMGQQHMYSQGRRNNTAPTTGCGTPPLARSTAFRTASAHCRKCSVSLMMKM